MTIKFLTVRLIKIYYEIPLFFSFCFFLKPMKYRPTFAENAENVMKVYTFWYPPI